MNSDKDILKLDIKQKSNRDLFRFYFVICLPAAIAVLLYIIGIYSQNILLVGIVCILAFPTSILFYNQILQDEMWIVLHIFLLFVFINYRIYKKRENLWLSKFSVCPYCNKSILVYEKWQCDHCYNFQKKERYIFDKCQICGRFVDIFCCEHCHKEIRIR